MPRAVPLGVRITGVTAALLFVVVAVQIFVGSGLNALSRPLPFLAYPLLVTALLGWTWQRFRNAD